MSSLTVTETTEATGSPCGVAHQAGMKIPSGLAFSAGLFSIVFMSSGLTFGTGPFASKLIEEGYIEGSAVSMIFSGSFLMLTWGAVVSAHLSTFLGPQVTSLLGMLIQLPGFVFFALLEAPADPTSVMIAYGLISFGGFMLFANALQFALLYHANFSVADSVLSGMFNTAGLVFLLMNIDSISFTLFFQLYLAMWGLVFIVVLVFYPSQPYNSGDSATIGACSLRHIRNPFDFSEYRRYTFLMTNPRFLNFALFFSLGTVFNSYILGLICEPIYDFGKEEENRWYTKWYVPIVTNLVVIFSFPIGLLVKKTGFGVPGLVSASSCTIATVLCFCKSSTAAAFLNPILMNLMQALIYSLEFIFLHTVMPVDGFTTGMATIHVMMGVLNFIPWPGMHLVFGDKIQPALMVLLLLSLMMYVWPAYELFHYGVQEQVGLEEITARSFLSVPTKSFLSERAGSFRPPSMTASLNNRSAGDVIKTRSLTGVDPAEGLNGLPHAPVAKAKLSTIMSVTLARSDATTPAVGDAV